MFAAGWWLAFLGWGSFPTRSLYCVSESCFLSDYIALPHILGLLDATCLLTPLPGFSTGSEENSLGIKNPLPLAKVILASNYCFGERRRCAQIFIA